MTDYQEEAKHQAERARLTDREPEYAYDHHLLSIAHSLIALTELCTKLTELLTSVIDEKSSALRVDKREVPQ